MDIQKLCEERILYFDGAMGTMLQENGLAPGEYPESFGAAHPDVLQKIHTAYIACGCDVITANTFGASPLKYGNDLEAVVRANLAAARQAANSAPRKVYVACDIGPLGKMLKPLGDFAFEDAVKAFSATAAMAEKYGADLVIIETMNDLYELKAAVLGVKEACGLPVIASVVFDETHHLMTGADPAAVVATLEGLGVDALGLNCSLGPQQMVEIVPELVKYASVPVIVSPNAGLPKSVNGKTVYDVDANAFSDAMRQIAEEGASILGGCCGTTPAYMAETIAKTKDIHPKKITQKEHTLVASYTHAVEIGGENRPVLIGERINPTGKKRFKQALRENDMQYILQEGISQQENGADILDVNVGLPEIDEADMIGRAVFELQSVLDLPLQIDTTDTAAMEKALRLYNGKALVNSVNGKAEVMDSIFPLVQKYGGAVIALTLDEDGIPETIEKRVEIAEKIISRAKDYGIAQKDIVVDPLAMTVSSGPTSALVTLQTVETLAKKGIRTSLGVSNVSFGLPNRGSLNAAFFTMAMQKGLSAGIVNVLSPDMMRAYYAYLALGGFDRNFEKYIANIPKYAVALAAADGAGTAGQNDPGSEKPLQRAIIKGLKEEASRAAKTALQTAAPLELIDSEIIPALNIQGQGFEAKTVFLPQLLMSAEAAKAAFEEVKAAMSDRSAEKKGRIILATVKNDIHDIGKNIVKVLLENYGFEVIDLGRDVDPQLICDTAVKEDISLVGLSALMTTTVPSMEETIKMLKAAKPDCKVVVGGAVLTQEYADMIHADRYARDAMETVRYAEAHFAGA